MLDIAKRFAGKAENLIEEKVENAKKSKAFETVSGEIDKAAGYVKDKYEDLKQSGVKEKIETLAEQAEDKAEETLSKLKILGKQAAEKTADKLEDLADTLRKKTSSDENPE